MKTISAVMITGIFLVLTNIRASAQRISEPIISVIEPYHLDITYSKTSNLIFPYAIKSVDRGSKDILVQKAKGVENVLQVKAGKENFKETNLTVITADGRLYSYLLNYVENPSILNIRYARERGKKEADAFFSNSGANEADIEACAKQAAGEERTIRGIRDKKDQMELSLKGLFIKDNVMYWQIQLENHSNISFDIDQLRFFICDQKKSKRTAAQENEIKPLYTYGHPVSIAGKAEQVFVFALPKFTIPDKKNFKIQVMEKNGGRHLELKIYSSTIVDAQSLVN
ncbi:conjugative transposon protein TraN [Rubrolithibacter danxiaensis]|uniref:conjugative transposon protein TraN n=1 Tax=Rubrolithibacter danxiaensis TaxID=3390805 RepID=UPI003BF8E8CF